MLTLFASIDAALNVVQTVLGIGGLIFVHELGHFLVGRWCGVRAEVFSIGFGPAIAKWTPGKTEYRLAPVPLGGYVKFLGENPEDGITAPDSFLSASYPRKAAIMLAGVTMNVIVAFILFAWTFSIGVDLPAPKVGAVTHGLPAWAAGLEPGDEIVSVDGRQVLEFMDVAQDVVVRDRVSLVVRRDGRELPPFTIRTIETEGGIRRLGIEPARVVDDILRVEPGSPAALAGFQEGDRVVSFDDAPTLDVVEALDAWRQAKGGSFVVLRDGAQLTLELPYETTPIPRIGVAADSLRVGPVREGGPAHAAGLRLGDLPDLLDGRPVTSIGTLFESLMATGAAPRVLTVERGNASIEIPIGADPAAFAASLSPADEVGLVVRPFTADGSDSPAAAAGIVPGTEVLEADGKTVDGIGDVSDAVTAAHAAGRAVRMRVRFPDGREAHVDVVPAVLDAAVEPGFSLLLETHTVRETDLVGAILLGIERTDRWVHRILATLGSLVTGKVSATRLSGPVAIAKQTYREAESGFGKFLLFLGMISMNLAVLNLLPIPLLDGGQLAMLTAERVRGRPLPESVQAGLQWVGLILLLGLMVFVVANDLRNL